MAAASRTIRILAVTGSLRKASANSALLRFAAQAAKGLNAEVVFADVALPLFDQDVEAAGYPAACTAIRQAAASCDAVLFSTPEYNYSTSPVTSNAIAWLSRAGPEGKSPIAGKPAAFVSAGGGAGGLRAQMHARDSVQYLDMKVLSKPEFTLNLFDGTQRFDKVSGDLTDVPTQERITAVVAALVAWTVQLAK
jgi:chromate reductase